MDRGPGEVLADIERTNGELIQAGDEFSKARKDAGKNQLNYELSVAKKTVEIYQRGKDEGKIPAEDVRKAMAHLAIDPEVWKRHLMSVAEVDARKRFIDTRQSVLTGLQSELQQMRVEFSNA